MFQLCPLPSSSLLDRQMHVFLDEFREPVAIKDSQLCYQYANAAYAQLLRVSQLKSLLGHSDVELCTFSSALRKHFQQRDNEVLSSLNPYESVLLLQEQGQMHGYWHQRRPLLNSHYQVLGVVLTATALGHLDWMPTLDKQIDTRTLYKATSYTLVDKDELLNENELIVLFFLLRLGSFSAIAAHSDFPLAKIHTHMRSLYSKFHCQTKKILIKKAIDKGYWFYIPKAIFARYCPTPQEALPWPSAARVTLPSVP